MHSHLQEAHLRVAPITVNSSLAFLGLLKYAAISRTPCEIQEAPF